MKRKIYLLIKRLIDIFGSIAGILFCLALIWWWVFLINLFVTRFHPFFSHSRVGKNGKTFKCLKFRTLKFDTDPNLTSLDDQSKESTSKFGYFLRKSSLDETLQLFNIFLGQMSFIGPRPLIDVRGDSVTIKIRKENGSISLRPGLSGLAQIHSRSDLDPVLKAQYDGEYFKKLSLWLDIKIFFLTIFKIFGAGKGR